MRLYWLTYSAILASAAWGTSAAAAVLDDGVREKPTEFTYGVHPVLQADVVELEFRVDKTTSKRHDYSRKTPVTDIVSQNFSMEYRITPVPEVSLSQTVKFGGARRREVSDVYFRDKTEVSNKIEDLWNQLQRTELSLRNESKVVQMKLFEQYRQAFHSDQNLPNSYFSYGGSLSFRITRNLFIAPEWSMEERTDYLLRRTTTERYGARLSWRAFQGVSLQPETYVERLTDYRGQPRERHGVGMALVKTFPRQKISVRIKPLYIDEYVDFGHSGNRGIERLDGSISWRPSNELTIRTGGVVERQDRYIQKVQTTNEKIYTSVKHQPVDHFAVSFRGDYRLDRTDYEYEAYDDKEDAELKLSVTPELKINDDLVALAQYQYEYANNPQGAQYPDEQILSVSLRGQF